MTSKSGGRCPFAKGQVSPLTKRYCDYNWCIKDPLFEACFVTNDSRVNAVSTSRRTETLLDPQQPQDSVAITLVQLQKHRLPAAKRMQNEYYYGTPFRQSNGGAKRRQARVGASYQRPGNASPHHCRRRYKRGWGIELFLQMAESKNLKIRKVFGRSENFAVKVQTIYCFDHLSVAANEPDTQVYIQVLAPLPD